MSRPCYPSYLVLVFILSCSVLALRGQEYQMTNDTIYTCSGSFTDDNGVLAPYSATDYQMTICPEMADVPLIVDFISFQLQDDPDPSNSDVLLIYDGMAISSPFLGSYSGNGLQGLSVQPTENNTTGCLTFAFIVSSGNTLGLPGFQAQISCDTTCQDPPLADIDLLSPTPPVFGTDSVVICMGQTLIFSGDGSSQSSGAQIIEYSWDFDDGTVISGPEDMVQYEYTETGFYEVLLSVTDESGCDNEGYEVFEVYVVGPQWFLDYDEYICIGEETTLDAQVTGVVISNNGYDVVADPWYLADGAGFTFNSDLLVTQFNDSDSILSCTDLEAIHVNMSHSYLGDLEVVVECPNGTSVILQEFGSGGGGTFLGEANDNSTDPGVGYDYGWSPSSTSGFIHDDANHTFTNYITTTGESEANDIVNPGIYQSDYDLCDLVGCPLNGNWSLSIIDNLGIDDGWVFEWGVEFNSQFYIDTLSVTSQYGQGADSTFWNADPLLDMISADGNTATFSSDVPGEYQFTFTALSDYGCNMDSTITVNVVDYPEIEFVTEDTVNSNGSVVLGDLLGAPSTCDYELILTDTWGNGWDGSELEVIIDGIGTTYTLEDGANESFPLTGLQNGATLEIVFTEGVDAGENGFSLLDSNGDVVIELNGMDGTLTEGIVYSGGVTCDAGLLSGYVFGWSPSIYLDDPQSQTPLADSLPGDLCFYVEYALIDAPGCISTDTVCVHVPDSLVYTPAYFEFPDSQAVWTTETTVWTDLGGDVHGHVYLLSGDTTVNGADYSKMYVRESWFAPSFGDPVNYDQDTHPFQLVGGIREDGQKKVWFMDMSGEDWWEDQISFYSGIPEGTEVLLYDFSMEVGDTITNQHQFGESYLVLTDIVTGVLDRDNYIFTDEFGNFGYYRWVQGMGALFSSPFGLYQVNRLFNDISVEMTCHWVNGENVYYSGNSTEDCLELVLSVDELEESRVEIWPNPAEDILYLTLPIGFDNNSNSRIEVVDIEGRIVLMDKIQIESKLEIDVPHLSKGLYTLRLINEKSLYSARFVKR